MRIIRSLVIASLYLCFETRFPTRGLTHGDGEPVRAPTINGSNSLERAFQKNTKVNEEKDIDEEKDFEIKIDQGKDSCEPVRAPTRLNSLERSFHVSPKPNEGKDVDKKDGKEDSEETVRAPNYPNSFTRATQNWNTISNGGKDSEEEDSEEVVGAQNYPKFTTHNWNTIFNRGKDSEKEDSEEVVRAPNFPHSFTQATQYRTSNYREDSESEDDEDPRRATQNTYIASNEGRVIKEKVKKIKVIKKEDGKSGERKPFYRKFSRKALKAASQDTNAKPSEGDRNEEEDYVEEDYNEGGVRKSVLMVSATNRCRSPMTAAIFRHMVKKRGMKREWRCDSAGLHVEESDEDVPGMHYEHYEESDVHLAEQKKHRGMDHRARITLRENRIKFARHTARQVEENDFNKYDFILGMDMANVKELEEKKPPGSRATIELLSKYDQQGSKLMRHPNYDAKGADPREDRTGFKKCYKIAVSAIEGFLNEHASG